MGLLGQQSEEDSQLQQIIEGLDEDVQRRALVQYHPSDARQRPMWGLLLLTRSALHVVYGHSENWATRIIRSSAMEQESLTIPKNSITSVEIPPRPTGIRRFFGSPTRIATIRTKDDDVIRVEVEDDGEALLRALDE